MISDERLMNEYKQGREDAFNVLYSRYSSMVYGYAKRRLPFNEVEDFYQKVWRRLHEKRHTFTDQPFAPWFFVLVKNLLVDEYRSIGRNKKLPVIEDTGADNHQLELDIEEVLAHLPADTAILVKKYYIEGFSFGDLEKDTGMSQTGLRKRLSRAIQSLKNKLRG